METFTPETSLLLEQFETEVAEKEQADNQTLEFTSLLRNETNEKVNQVLTSL